MGLFSRLFGKKEEPEDDFDPTEFEGLRIEVTDEDNRPLFIGRAGVTQSGKMELRPLNVPRLRPDTDGVAVTMRAYEAGDKQAVHIKGVLYPSGYNTWLVREAEVTGKDNERMCFRQNTDSPGEVTSMKQWGVSPEQCRLTNISVGGVGFWTEAEFLPGERVLVSAQLFEKYGLKPMICVVRRVSRRRFGYEYGCEFASMMPALEQKITRIIMELQRESKKK